MGAEPLEKITTMMAGGADRPLRHPPRPAGLIRGGQSPARSAGVPQAGYGHRQGERPRRGPLGALVWKGTLYALPMGVYTNVVAVNHDLLEQRGIAPPGPNWTVEQMVDIAAG